MTGSYFSPWYHRRQAVLEFFQALGRGFAVLTVIAGGLAVTGAGMYSAGTHHWVWAGVCFAPWVILFAWLIGSDV